MIFRAKKSVFFFVGQSDSSVDSDASNDSFDGDTSGIESETDVVQEAVSGADTCSLSNTMSPSASNSSPCANQRSVLAQAYSSVEYS